ncbi:MAG: DUF4422 domain-containing protein [Propionibacteriaceae bacterium]|jgi:hypothetical protein|nr:DUF4422 domain-containing protein [Propionibacteriaceae bacterium]
MKILVATHKPYPMPEEPIYLPVSVDSSQDLGYQRTDEGRNIAAKAAWYNELTALYWGWQNLAGDVIGLAHYRRLFKATPEAIEALLRRTDVIVPKRRHYYIETNASQFAHAHGELPLEVTREVIAARHRDYLDAYDLVMKRTWGHRFNMLIMKRPQLHAYCTWLFDILFAVEKELGTPPPRTMGFIAERLLDVWLEGSHTEYKELPVRYLERTNWLKKGSHFLYRKFRRKPQ